MQFFERDIISGNGKPMKVVWEYDGDIGIFRQENPAAFFNDIIIPKFEDERDPIWRDVIAGRYGYVQLVYNYELICFITNGNPLESNNWAGCTSFPDFVFNHLERWAGKRIEYWVNYPPQKYFRFNCFSYQSGNNNYYLAADTEKALTRDFKAYPATEDEKRVWRSIMHNSKIAKATDADRARFLAGYLLRKDKYLYDFEDRHYCKAIKL